jgi:hypothetical protein
MRATTEMLLAAKVGNEATKSVEVHCRTDELEKRTNSSTDMER